MAKSVRNVIAGVSKEKQLTGMTMEEIRCEFLMAGYGGTKAQKRSRELLVSAQIQYTGERNKDGLMLYFCVYWPFAAKKVDVSRVGSYTYADRAHTQIVRLDKWQNAYDLTAEPIYF